MFAQGDPVDSQWTRRDFCRTGVGAAGLVMASGLPLQADQTKPEMLFVPEKFPRGWVHFSAEEGHKLEETWKVGRDEKTGDSFLRCLGKPFGYIRTVAEFDNYEFGLQWRYVDDPNGNSGILLHTSKEKDRIWPKSIQIQLHRPKAGSVFPSGEAEADNRLDVKDLDLPLKEWNTCVVACVDGRISLTINKKKIGEVTGCVPSKGAIALQSEGAEIHFQKLWIRRADPPVSS
jgi:hypothetical protein